MSNSQPWHYFPLFPVYAFTDLDKARKKVRSITGEKFNPVGESGTFSYYKSQDGCGEFGIIYLSCENDTPSQKYACLAHECVHYARTFAESIRAEQLEEETEAYVMEAAMLACIDQIGEEWFTTPLQPKPKNQKKTD